MARYSDRVKSIIVIEGKEIPVIQDILYIYSKIGSELIIAFTEIDSKTNKCRLILINPEKIDYIKSTEWQ